MRNGLRLVVVGVVAALALLSLPGAALASPGGIPGPPDQPTQGEPPVSGVVRPFNNGDANSANRGGPQKTNNLKYGGGAIQATPSVYIVFWGNQWPTTDPTAGSTDPVAKYLVNFLNGLYAGENWTASTRQYCSGVAVGSTSCPTNATFVGSPSGSLVRGVWVDNSVPAPSGASQSQLAAEARKAASHFSSSPLGANAQIVVATPASARPQGFGTSYCAWHSYTSGAGIGTIAYTNLPYMPSAGAACGQNFVRAGSEGAYDGVSIVEGHEFAETITDPLLNAWLDQQGQENADKCAWIPPSNATGGARVLNLATGAFAVQGLWSNATGGCVNGS